MLNCNSSVYLLISYNLLSSYEYKKRVRHQGCACLNSGQIYHYNIGEPSMKLRIAFSWLHTKKGGSKMRWNTIKPMLAAKFCLLLLSAVLVLAACGDYHNPGAPPNGTPQATPTNGGYSIIYLIDHEMQGLLVPYRR